LSADFKTPSRHEFNDYLSWVAQALPNIHWQEEGLKLDFDGDIFHLETSKNRYQAHHIAIGTGLCQNIPCWAKPFLNPKNCFHSAQFTTLAKTCEGKKVAVIGGGQSGAEIILQLLQEKGPMPAQIAWLTERSNFLPLAASPFVNEYFTPAYVHHFYHLPEARKKQILKEQELAGSGISPETLLALAQCLYERQFHDGCLPMVKLLPYRRIFDMEAVGNGFQLNFRNLDHESDESMLCNMVILATGYRYKMPAFLKPIASLLEHNMEGLPVLQESFAAKWQGSEKNQIYFLNAGYCSHGIAEPQLSLMAWRSAAIINHLLRQDFYDINDGKPLLSWDDSLYQQHLVNGSSLLHRDVNTLG
jgi:lysine N6-hydroxylase